MNEHGEVSSTEVRMVRKKFCIIFSILPSAVMTVPEARSTNEVVEGFVESLLAAQLRANRHPKGRMCGDLFLNDGSLKEVLRNVTCGAREHSQEISICKVCRNAPED